MDLKSQDCASKLPSDFVLALQQDVVPLIQESVAACHELYEMDEYNDNMIFGFCAWRNTFNRIYKNLDRDKWLVRTGKNDLRISLLEKHQQYVFRIYKTEEDSQQLTGRKRAKKDYLMLPGFEDYMSEMSNLVITYGVNLASTGLMSIKVGRLMGTKMSDIQTIPIATLYVSEQVDTVSTGRVAEPEQIRNTELHRDVVRRERDTDSKGM